MMIEITDANFAEIVVAKEITIIDFFAEWCGPCKMITPVIENIAKNNEDITVGKVDIDVNRVIGNLFGIRSVPTIIFMKNGKMVDKFVGVKSIHEIQAKIDSLK